MNSPIAEKSHGGRRQQCGVSWIGSRRGAPVLTARMQVVVNRVKREFQPVGNAELVEDVV
jgi:hypothetical protein